MERTKKLSIVFIIVGILLFLVSGCRTPKQVVERIDTVRTVTINNYQDTTWTTKITKIIINKIDSMQKEITIHQQQHEITHGNQRHARDSIKSEKEVVKDNLTPTLKKLDNKHLNDSLKGEKKIAKEVRKNTEASNETGKLKIILFIVLTAVGGIITMKIFRFLKL